MKSYSVSIGVEISFKSEDPEEDVAITKRVIRASSPIPRIYTRDVEEFIDVMIAMGEAMYPIPPPVSVG